MDIFGLICCKNWNVCLKKTKNKWKSARDLSLRSRHPFGKRVSLPNWVLLNGLAYPNQSFQWVSLPKWVLPIFPRKNVCWRSCLAKNRYVAFYENKKVTLKLVPHFGRVQCDQIWRNIDFCQIFINIWEFSNVFGKFLTLLGKFLCYFGKFSLL